MCIQQCIKLGTLAFFDLVRLVVMDRYELVWSPPDLQISQDKMATDLRAGSSPADYASHLLKCKLILFAFFKCACTVHVCHSFFSVVL